MKRILIFTIAMLLVTLTNISAQIQLNREGQKYLLLNTPAPYNIRHNIAHNSAILKTSKYTGTTKMPGSTKFREYTHGIDIVNYTINNFLPKTFDDGAKTFDESTYGDGVNLNLTERTSLNLGLGCYETQGNVTTDDSCDHSPDLDMNVTLVFDLK